jgi:hypothetical protein
LTKGNVGEGLVVDLTAKRIELLAGVLKVRAE